MLSGWLEMEDCGALLRNRVSRGDTRVKEMEWVNDGHRACRRDLSH
jgi:hypothetical protein